MPPTLHARSLSIHRNDAHARVAAGKRNGPFGGRPKGDGPPTRQIRVYEHDAELTAEARRRATTTAQVVAELRSKPPQKSCP